MNQNPKELFKWKDNWKPIIIFYYNNWFWKTTLFNFIKSTFLWKIIKEKFMYEFILEIKLNNNIFILKNSSINKEIKVLCDYKKSSYEKFKEKLENNILNKNEKLAVAWKNTSWEQNRNTLASLLRFNFFTDDEFKKFSQSECSLINNDVDWDTKWMLFNYILWEVYDIKKENLFKIAYRYWAKQKILENTKKLEKKYKDYFSNINQTKLFEDPEEEFNKLLNKKFEIKNNLLEINSIILKLNELKNENKIYLNENNIISDLIKNEYKDFKKEEKRLKSKYENISWRLIDLKDEYWNLIKWVPTNIQKAVELRKNSLIFVNKYKNDVEKYYRENNKLLNEYKNLFLKELTNWNFKFNNIEFNNRKLRLILSWNNEKKWDWRLKTLRFLALIGIILFKWKNKNSRNLWIWFFDSPFYWVDVYNSTKSLKSISKFIDKNKINTQLFIFATKEEKREKKDSFEEELEKNKKIYFHTYTDNNKEYLIS